MKARAAALVLIAAITAAITLVASHPRSNHRGRERRHGERRHRCVMTDLQKSGLALVAGRRVEE